MRRSTETQPNQLDIAVVGAFDELIPAGDGKQFGYGGIERVAAGLVNGLNDAGHKVTLFASGESTVPLNVELVACTPMPIRHMELAADQDARRALSMNGLTRAIKHIRDKENQGQPYDIIHFNYGPEWLPLMLRDAAGITTPCVTTFHGPLTQNSHLALFEKDYNREPVISISDDQREPLPDLNYVATVYNGVNTEHLTFRDSHDDFLAFLGRIHPDKGPEDAIKIAVQTGRELKIAAKIDPNPNDQAYYKERIKPLLEKHKGQVEFLGEVDDTGKNELLGNAYALLAPVAKSWKEPFGLVYAEAGACGAPVVGRPHGAIHEVVEHGKTGLLFQSVAAMVRNIKAGKVDAINREDCRTRVERLFSYPVMTLGYIAAYRKVLAGKEL